MLLLGFVSGELRFESGELAAQSVAAVEQVGVLLAVLLMVSTQLGQVISYNMLFADDYHYRFLTTYS
jgi:hypothetical protein